MILNISLLKDNGFKISKIAQMSAEEISQKISLLTESEFRFPEQIQALTLSMLNLDEERFEKTMSTSILQLGFEKTMINIIYPFLGKVGILWQTGAANSAHEHFITNLIRQKLLVAIDGQFVTKHETTKKYLLFLPEGEMHELGLLFASYIIKARNHQVVYLGQNLPFEDLKKVFDIQKPDFLVTILTTSLEGDSIAAYINKVSATFSSTKLLVSGRQVIGQDLKVSENIIIYPRKELFIDFVDQH